MPKKPDHVGIASPALAAHPIAKANRESWPAGPASKSRRGGARENAGRPPQDGVGATEKVAVRLQPLHADAFRALGGVTWLRQQLDAALGREAA